MRLFSLKNMKLALWLSPAGKVLEWKLVPSLGVATEALPGIPVLIAGFDSVGGIEQVDLYTCGPNGALSGGTLTISPTNGLLYGPGYDKPDGQPVILYQRDERWQSDYRPVPGERVMPGTMVDGKYLPCNQLHQAPE